MIKTLTESGAIYEMHRRPRKPRRLAIALAWLRWLDRTLVRQRAKGHESRRENQGTN